MISGHCQFQTIEAEQFFDIGINLEKCKEEKQALIDRKQVHMDALGLRIDNLCFWNEITTGDITTKEERKAAFLATKPTLSQKVCK